MELVDAFLTLLIAPVYFSVTVQPQEVTQNASQTLQNALLDILAMVLKLEATLLAFNL